MAWYENSTQKTAVREYKERKEMERDANAAAEHGWRISSQSEQTQRVGCARILMTGFLALLWKPKPRILVTYIHD